jgi:hypothetical protein
LPHLLKEKLEISRRKKQVDIELAYELDGIVPE